MYIPDDIRKSVVFVCYRDKNQNIKFAGTAFFVAESFEENNELGFAMTITAKHVIVAVRSHSIDDKVLIRINVIDGGYEYLESNATEWLFHPDDTSVDVAVFDWSPDPNKYDVLFTRVSMAVTTEMLGRKFIGVGHQVFMVGLFVNHLGTKRNLPIVRSGNIAMMGEEPIPTTHFGSIDGILIESRSIGGLSGSPVFVYHEGVEEHREGSQVSYWPGRHIYWLGLVHGHYDIKAPEPDGVVEDGTLPDERINMGIAIVVPATKVMEVINQPKFVSGKKRAIAEYKKQSTST